VPSPLFAGEGTAGGKGQDDVPISTPFSIKSGRCALTKEGCITSPNFPSLYGNDDHCEISVTSDSAVVLNVEEFQTEAGYDFVTLDDSATKRYAGSESPHLQTVMKIIKFDSDESVAKGGWQICASQEKHPDPHRTYKAKCSETGDDIAETHGTKLRIKCPDECSGGYIWGTDTYTRDSKICRAGLHATGGTEFLLEFLDGRIPPAPKMYRPSYQNKVLSFKCSGLWSEAFAISSV
jgi:hypothetical protein